MEKYISMLVKETDSLAFILPLSPRYYKSNSEISYLPEGRTPDCGTHHQMFPLKYLLELVYL